MAREDITLFGLILILAVAVLARPAVAQLGRARAAIQSTAPAADSAADPAADPDPDPAPRQAPVAQSRPAPTPAESSVRAAGGSGSARRGHLSQTRRQSTGDSPPLTGRVQAAGPARVPLARPSATATSQPPRDGVLNRVRDRVRQEPAASAPPTPPPVIPPVNPPPTPPRNPPHSPRQRLWRGGSRGHQQRNIHHYFQVPPVIYVPDYCQSSVVLQEYHVPDLPQPPAPSEIPQPLTEPAIEAPQPLSEPRTIHSLQGPVPSCQPFITPQYVPRRYTAFPYQYGDVGTLSADPNKTWTGSFRLEYGNSFNGLSRRAADLMIENCSGAGFELGWHSYSEDLGAGLTDELHLADINLLYRVARTDHLLIRAGLGVNLLGDAFGSDAGFNMTAKADVFPAEPWVVSGEFDLGTIGDAEMFHAAGKIGLMLDRVELFGGYDYRDIGGVALQGPMVGIQVWF